MKIKLTRTGNAPIEFDGEKIAESIVEPVQDAMQCHHLYLYRTGDKFVVQIAWRTDAKGELNADYVEVVDGIESAGNFLNQRDPLQNFIGPPDGHPKKKLIQQRLTAQYFQQVSDLLDGFPVQVQP